MIQLVIDHDAHEIKLNEKAVKLPTDRHYELVTYMAMNTKRSFQPGELIQAVYGPNVQVSIEDLVNDVRREFDRTIDNSGLIIVEAIDGKFSIQTEGVHIHIIDDQNSEVVPLPMNGTSNTEQPRRPIFPNPAGKKQTRPRAEKLLTERDEVPRRASDRKMPSVALTLAVHGSRSTAAAVTQVALGPARPAGTPAALGPSSSGTESDDDYNIDAS